MQSKRQRAKLLFTVTLQDTAQPAWKLRRCFCIPCVARLDISNNCLTALPSSMSKLRQLQTLRLSFNQLQVRKGVRFYARGSAHHVDIRRFSSPGPLLFKSMREAWPQHHISR